MFSFFLEEYRKNIYKGARFRKNIPVSEKIWFGIFLVQAPLLFVFYFSRRAIALGVSLLVMVIAAGILSWLVYRHRSQFRDKEMEDYLNRMIRPLKELLQDKKYGFYSAQGIDWLIACCEKEMKGKKRLLPGIMDSSFKWVFPFVTLLIGVCLEKWSAALSLELLLQILIIIILIWFLYVLCKMAWYQVPEDVSWLFGLTKAALPPLLSALEYIRTFVTEASTVVSPLPCGIGECSRATD